jgi:hypothetical protein
MHEPKGDLARNPVCRQTCSGRLLRSQLGAAIIVTYIFWAAFSLVNFDFLGALALPFLFIWSADFYMKFSDFLTSPIQTAALVATFVGLTASLVHGRLCRDNPIPYLVPMLVNAVFLTTFLVCAERAKNEAIAAAMKGRNPDCMVISSFFDSVRNAAQEFQMNPHALFTENGKMYHWSYASMNFFEGQDNYNRNFACYTP